MVNWDKINKKISVKKVILPIFAVLLLILISAYLVILHKHIQKNNFVKEMKEISEKNLSPTFSVQKIYLCSSANVENHTLDEIKLYQYTDIAIYINNYSENGLTKNNTVKQLYIDNIDLNLASSIGSPSLVYTNLLKIGSKEQPSQKPSERIDFNIVNTNEQNAVANYEEPTFYADCSNPISLKYINKFKENYSIARNSILKFDGSLLEKVGINIQDINCELKFKVNIINNNDEYCSAWINFKIPLNEIYEGVSIRSKNTVGREYDFLKSR